MALPEPQAPDLRAALEAVVRPLFSHLKSKTPDGSVPEIVLRHRRRRAEDRIVDALVSRGTASVPADLRKEVEALLRRWAAASFSDGLEAAERFEIRCAREHDRVVAEESGDKEQLLAVLEEEYRRRVIEQFGTIELRGIQTTHRILESLDEVYVPLHLEESPTLSIGEQVDLFTFFPGSKRELMAMLADHRHVLVLGSPGSGKSTLVAYLATRLASRQLALDGSRAPLPLIFTVRAAKKSSLTVASLSEHTGCELDVIERALGQEAFLLIDGLDEAPQELREGLIASLQRFLYKYPRVRLLATSRPVGVPGALEKQIHGLRPFRITDLTREEVDIFIDKWCFAAEKSIVPNDAQAKREALKASEDLKRRLAASYSVQRIAVNPLLVTILCVVHRFLGRTIPEHRVTLYEKCTDALLYEWDRAKFSDGSAISHLDALAKRRLLMGVAKSIHEEHAGEISEKEVIRHFTDILPDLGRPASDAKAIVEEIRDRSGLLVERRPGFFAFSHLTFQEYLCALEFVRTKSYDELLKHRNDSWWHEVIILAAGATGGSGGAIPRKLLSRKTAIAVFLAAQCLETDTDMPLQLRMRIETALQRFVPPEDLRAAQYLSELGIIAAPILMRSLNTNDYRTHTTRTWTLFALDEIEYDPAIPAIAQCVTDERSSGFIFGFTPGDWHPTIGAYAAFVLARKALSSAVAKRALQEVLPLMSKAERKDLHRAFEGTHGDNPDSQEVTAIFAKIASPDPKRAASIG